MNPSSFRRNGFLKVIGLLAALQGVVAAVSIAASAAPGRTVVNAGGSPLAYLNLAHGLSPGSAQVGWPSILTVDGYPSGTTKANISGSNVVFDPTYFGRYRIWWTGSGNFQLSPPAIVYSGGVAVSGIGPGNDNGSQPYNFTIGLTRQPTSRTPVEFAFGTLIKGVADNGSGLVRLTGSLPNAFSVVHTGAVYRINNVTNLAAGPWTVTKVDDQHIDLQGSSYRATMAVVGGRVGAQSEAIMGVSGATWYFLAGTFTGFGDMVLCKSSDVAAINAGRLVNPDYVSVFRNLNPRFIRFMDYTAVIGGYASSYKYRPRPSQLSWGVTNQVKDYWPAGGGAIANGGSDNYTMANPAASPAGGPPVDGEVVAGYISGANTGYNPTLAIAGRTGSAPILNHLVALLSLTMTGTVPPTATTISFVFTGGGLSTPFTYNYLTSTSASGPGGRTDTSFENIAINIRADINANTRGNSRALAAAGIFSANPEVPGAQMTFKYNPNINSSGTPTLGAGLTIRGSDSAASGKYNFGFVQPGYLAANALFALTYSALAGGWVSTPGSAAQGGGVHGGPPLEFYEDFCLQADVGLWLNTGVLWSADYIYNAVLHIARSGVRELAVELHNETWNAGTNNIYWNLGSALGLKTSAIDGFHGLLTVHMAAPARAAWAAAGRNPAQLFIVNAYQFVSASSAVTNRFNGAALNPASNVTLAAFGGPVSNGTTKPAGIATNYSAFPNRPIDNSDLVSPAPYWRGGQYNAGFGGGLRTGRPLSAYNDMLVAAYNWVNGNSAQQTAALDFLYNSRTGHGDLYDGTLAGKVENNWQLGSWADGSGNGAAGYFGIGKIVASYDAQRASRGLSVLGVAGYEGDFEGGPVWDGEVTAVASSLTSLGDTPGYTSRLPGAAVGGPASDAASDARNMRTLLVAFKNDARFAALYARYFKDFQTAVTSGGNRIALPSTYGFEGGSIWAKYPESIYSTPYKSWDAIKAFDN